MPGNVKSGKRLPAVQAVEATADHEPFAGMLSDRYGGAKVVAAGTVLYGLGLAVMSAATTPMALYLGCGAIVGVALSCTAFTRANKTAC